MKYLTLVVPCYNSQAYMKRCIDSLLPGGEDVEIIIIDDGSGDDTGEIADTYETLYPNIVRAVHKENGGHGSGVNMGLKLAGGLYFKVVDSDDWLDKGAYEELLQRIKQMAGKGEMQGAEQRTEHGAQRRAKLMEKQLPELLICNYVYDHLEEGITRIMRYDNVFPAGRSIGWNEIGRFRPSQYLVMHALIFRTDILRESGIRLPVHTFYVDNLFSYKPLPNVRKLLYLDLNLYHYYLGRADQSVNQKVMISRIDQLIRVTGLVIKSVDLREVRERKLAAYMRRNISIMLAMTSIHLLLMDSREGYEKCKKLWESIRAQDRGLYLRLRFTTLSGLTYLPGRLLGKLTLWGYRMANRIYHFQ